MGCRQKRIPPEAAASGTGASVRGTGRAAVVVGAETPVLPVSTRMEPRYAVPVWIAMSVAFAAGCRDLAAAGSRAGRRAAFALAAVACLAGLVLNRQDSR